MPWPWFNNKRGLTCRSTGAPTAWHPGRAAPCFILRRAARAPRRRRPVNSTLDHAKRPPQDVARFGQDRRALEQACIELSRSRDLASPQDRGRAVARQYKAESVALSQRPRPNGLPFIKAGKCMARFFRSKLLPPVAALGQARAKRKSSRVTPCTLTSPSPARSQALSGASRWPKLINRRGLTCRSTGAPTARQPGREAQHVHHPPRGRAPSPSSPG